ncbi:MAG TPA: cell division protein FtsB [Casimicrobiaceae bacterium]
MRILAIVFVLLILALQYPMWLGKGGWVQVGELNARVVAQRQTNAELKARNEALDAEVRDLKEGFEAIEERARSELGMIRQDEVFFQLPGDAPVASPSGKRGAGEAQTKDSGFPLPRE